MLQKVAEQKDQRERGRPRKRGERTPQGQQRQIAARISNGVHFQSPVLPGGIESQADWDAHLGSLEEALQPVGRWEKYCVYRVALSAWQFFRLTRHISSIIGKSVTQPDNGFTSSYDENYVHPGDVGEVLRRTGSSLEEELFQKRDLMLRVSALGGEDFSDIAFTAVERRQILSAIIEQSSPRSDEEEDEGEDEGELTGDDVDPDDAAVDNEDTVIIPAAQLREEIEQLVGGRQVAARKAIQGLVGTLAEEITNRGRRLKLARTNIGVCLVPDEKNVNRLALYERQLDSVSHRYLNDLYRAQALRLGQPVAAPIAVDVNVVGESSNGLH